MFRVVENHAAQDTAVKTQWMDNGGGGGGGGVRVREVEVF